MKILSKKDKPYLIGILVFLISLGIYIHTLAPSITFEDSGELVTAPYTLGISHPPGYPLYTLIMKVMITLLPISNIAFRGNLATAIFGSLGVMMVYFIVLKIEKNLIKEGKTSSEILLGGYVSAVVASLLASFSGMIWLHSITTEVYTLNLFLMMLLVYFLLLWEENRNIRYVFFGALIYGLSFGNHQQAILFFPAFLYFFLITDWREILKTRNIIFIVFMFGLGSLIYIYMPIRSARDPYLDWSNPERWRGFLFSIKREQYGPLGASRDLKKWFQQLNLFGFVEQVNIFTFFFSFLGIWRLFRKNLKLFTTLSMMTFCSSIGFIYIANPPIPTHIFALLRTFYLPLYALVAIWIGFGVSFTLEKIYFYWYRVRPVSRTCRTFVLLSFMLLPISSIYNHYGDYDLSRYYFAYDFGKNIAMTVEEKSVVFTYLSGDTFPLWYYKYSEGRREDMVVIHQRMASLPWYYAQVIQNEPQMVFTQKQFADWNVVGGGLRGRAQLITKGIMENNPQYKFYYTVFTKNFLPKKDPLKLKGILWLDKKEKIAFEDEKVWMNYSYRGLGDKKSLRNVRADEIMRQLFNFNMYLGRKYLKGKNPEMAIYQFQLANKIKPTPEAYYNMGFAYYRKNNIGSAMREFRQFLKIDQNSLQAKNVREWMKKNTSVKM